MQHVNNVNKMSDSYTQKLLLLQTEYYLKQELKTLCKIMQNTTFYKQPARNSAITLLENTLNPLRKQLGFAKLELCKNGSILASSSHDESNTDSKNDSDSE